MSKATKRKLRPSDNVMTTEQLAMKIVEQVERMSRDEKAKLRALLNREFGPAHAAKKLEGFARLLDAVLPRKLPWQITTRTESLLIETRGAFMAEETNQQTFDRATGSRFRPMTASTWRR
jgi:hypothetical protein